MTNYREIELERDLQGMMARLKELMREIDRRDETIWRLQTENDRLRGEIADVSRGLVDMTKLYVDLAQALEAQGRPK